VDEQVAEGERVVSRFTWTGTHRGSFLGILPTGKRVKVWGVVIDVVRDGQLSESRIIMDTFGLLQQLGAIPAADGAQSGCDLLSVVAHRGRPMVPELWHEAEL
jgi:hypothetical protein